ncbi:MAG: biotin/lipoyl-binding protein, partial [Muribaculaceae bacterium]
MKHIYYIAAAAALLTACTSEPQYDATGFFEATTTTLAAETPGKLMELYAEEGDSLRQGQLIAVVDTS